jgi:hypothetical protein
MSAVQEADMVGGKRWILWALVMGLAGGSFAVIGYVGKAAPKEKGTSVAPLAGIAQRPLEKKPVARPVPRESSSSTYANPEYGVTFRYPRNYPLDEGPLDEVTEDAGGLRTQADLESEQPGAILVATIAVPEDSFPNTTFAGGSVQVAVNRYLPEGGCQDYPVTRTGDAKAASGTITVDGVPFMWADSDQGEANTEYFERDYAGFANDRCYEFFVRVGVETVNETDQLKPVNQKKIMAQLEKIVTSSQLQPRAVSMLDQRPVQQIQRGRR